MNAWVILMVGAALLVPGSARYRLRGSRTNLRWRARRTPKRTSEQVVELISGLRDELMAGSALRPGLERAAGGLGPQVCPRAVAVSQLGGDVAEALRADADGDQMLLSLAALWQVCEGSGAALATALDRLVEGARQSARIRREVKAQLAGPRATMRVLAVLPLIGVGMGLLMGADPLGFLFTTAWGWLCLALAVMLEGAGMLWMRHLVRRIESQI